MKGVVMRLVVLGIMALAIAGCTKTNADEAYALADEAREVAERANSRADDLERKVREMERELNELQMDSLSRQF